MRAEKGFSPRPGIHKKNKLPGLNAHLFVKFQNGNVIANLLIGNQCHWFKIHIHIIADHFLSFICIGSEIFFQNFEIVSDLTRVHANKRGAYSKHCCAGDFEGANIVGTADAARRQ